MTKLITVEQGMEVISCSRGTFMKLAKQYDCIRMIGTRNMRIDIEKLLKCLEEDKTRK